MDTSDRQDCESSMRRIETLLTCKIFEVGNSRHVLQESAFIDLMICLRDILYKSEKYGRRVSFTDDILANEYVEDVTGAVTAVRDACCHIDSHKRLFDDHGNGASFMVAYGRCNVIKVNDLELNSEYEDDIAVFYGKNRLYFNRHIVRAFQEARAHLMPLMALRP